MDTNKILSADLLDLVFDNRNKDYGAYELRKTYHIRITKALVFTGLFVVIPFPGVVMANKLKPKQKSSYVIHDITIEDISPDEKKPEPIPEPPRNTRPPQIQTERLTPIQIVEDNEADKPLPTQEDLDDARIGLEPNEGVADVGIIAVEDLDEHKDIIQEKITKDPEYPVTFVEVQARYNGNWEKFLLRNLNPEVPVDNGAPEGFYTVLIQFVVDIDGSISDIRPLTSHGYGLEEEAVRVLRKATKWEPGIQNGHPVKSYRKQPITFQVIE
jgi:periplasmic protein TonB